MDQHCLDDRSSAAWAGHEPVRFRRGRGVEWHPGELYPHVGFLVIPHSTAGRACGCFYNQRGTAERWISGESAPT
jgi:hypothetical protein